MASIIDVFLTDPFEDLLSHQVFDVVSAVILLQKTEFFLGELVFPEVLDFGDGLSESGSLEALELLWGHGALVRWALRRRLVLSLETAWLCGILYV